MSSVAKRHSRGRGRILAVKLGLNPNSSSLGVDVTFMLFGAAVLSLMTPVVAVLLRLRRPSACPDEKEKQSAADRSDS